MMKRRMPLRPVALDLGTPLSRLGYGLTLPGRGASTGRVEQPHRSRDMPFHERNRSVLPGHLGAGMDRDFPGLIRHHTSSFAVGGLMERKPHFLPGVQTQYHG